MNYLAIFAFLLTTACLSQQQRLEANKSLQDTIDVNGSTETIPNVTEVGPQPKPNTTTVTPPTSKTTTISPTPSPTTVTPTTTTTTPKPTTPSPTTTVKPITTVKPTTTTPTSPPPTNATTAAPSTTTLAPSTTTKPIDPTTPVPEPHRRFDGPSFVGGIVLALGLVAIGFVAFKFYKARTESNYHTL